MKFFSCLFFTTVSNQDDSFLFAEESSRYPYVRRGFLCGGKFILLVKLLNRFFFFQPREVLTYPSYWQYAVLLNKFSHTADLEDTLNAQGYHPTFRGTLPYLPRSLKCYVSRTPRRFPSQKHQTGKLKEYYLLNAASVLPVLALEVKDGEDVLDLCAAPGGKSVVILQCARPGTVSRS